MIIETLKVQFGHSKKLRLMSLMIERWCFTLALLGYVKGVGCLGWFLFYVSIGDISEFGFDRKGVVVHVGYSRFVHYWNDEETQPLFSQLIEQCILFPTDIKYEV